MMERNSAIDIAKYVAAILVVAIHTHPLMDLAPKADFFFVEIVCRLAVPFFAICTGFYLARAIDTGGKLHPVWKSMKKIAKMYMGWSAFYLLVHLCNWYSADILNWSMFTGWMKSLVASSSFFHLWYLLALLYALPLFGITCRYLSYQWFPAIIVPVWSMHALEYGYGPFCPSAFRLFCAAFDPFSSVYDSLTRLYPLLLTGAWVAKEDLGNFTLRKTACWFTCMMACLVAEALLVRSIGGVRYSFILFTLPTTALLFCLVYSLGNAVRCDLFDFRLFAKISMVVYCLHPAIIRILGDLNLIQPRLPLFLFVAVASTLLSVIWYRVRKVPFLK